MDPSRPDRILDEWAAVAHQAQRPASPPRRVTVRGGLSGATLAGASLVLVAFVVAATVLSGRGPNDGIGGLPSSSSSPAASPADPTATPPASPTPTTATTPTARPTTGTCAPADLHARITRWEGAAGQRIADVELTYAGEETCLLRSRDRPQLVDGAGAVLIDGTDPSASAPIRISTGDVRTTLVQAGNYCGPAPVRPVSVAFVLGGGGRIVATPFSPTDATIPPCLGSGVPSDISMQSWSSR